MVLTTRTQTHTYLCWIRSTTSADLIEHCILKEVLTAFMCSIHKRPSQSCRHHVVTIYCIHLNAVQMFPYPCINNAERCRNTSAGKGRRNAVTLGAAVPFVNPKQDENLPEKNKALTSVVQIWLNHICSGDAQSTHIVSITCYLS